MRVLLFSFKCELICGCKKLEETMHVLVRLLSQDSTLDLFNFFPNFFPKFELPNSGCGLSASAAYTPVFTVLGLRLGVVGWAHGWVGVLST